TRGMDRRRESCLPTVAGGMIAAKFDDHLLVAIELLRWRRTARVVEPMTPRLGRAAEPCRCEGEVLRRKFNSLLAVQINVSEAATRMTELHADIAWMLRKSCGVAVWVLLPFQFVRGFIAVAELYGAPVLRDVGARVPLESVHCDPPISGLARSTNSGSPGK